MQVFVFVARATYFCTAVTALVTALVTGVGKLRSVADSQSAEGTLLDTAVILLAMSVFCVPALRALLRMVRGPGLIPEPLLRERSGIAAWVTASGLLANLLFAQLVAALVDIYRAPFGTYDDLGPMAFFALLMACAHVISLWTGELALIGSGQTDTARASTSARI